MQNRRLEYKNRKQPTGVATEKKDTYIVIAKSGVEFKGEYYQAGASLTLNKHDAKILQLHNFVKRG